MRTSSISRIFNGLKSLGNNIWNFIIKQEFATQKVELSSLVFTFGVSLPLSAFLYWRIYLDYFKKDYFEFCFSLEDVPYILYDKGTYVWLVVLLLSFPCIFFFMWKDSRFIKTVVATMLVGIGTYTLTSIGDFSFWQIVVYTILIVIANLFIFYYNRNILYVYSIFIGLFLYSSAQNDAIQAYKHPKKMSMTLKTGKVLIDKNDTTKIYLRSTSKFVLIYDKSKNELIRKERDSIQ